MTTTRPIRTWSITARLTALFTITTTLLVFIVVVVLLDAIARHLDDEHEHLLAEIVRVLQQSSAAGGLQTLVEELGGVESRDPASYSDPYFTRIVDARGGIVSQSRGMAAIPMTAYDGVPSTPPDARARTARWTASNGESFLLAKIDTRRGDARDDRFVVHVALNVTRDRLLVGDLRVVTIGLLAFALVAAAVAGGAVVRYSLRPVGRIASEVAVISAKELERRLSLTDRPRELHSLVHAFNTTLDRLERAFAGLSEYAENLAHELRTPLNNLKGEAEVALLHDRSLEEYRDVLTSSLEEYERLSKMSDGLLFLARADSHETRPSWEVVPLAETARAICEYFESVAEERHVILAVEGDASVSADAVLVRRAISNLVSNALAHVVNGHVTIAIAPTGDGGATVEVIDDGSGISPEDLPRVTDRFFRSHRARSSGRQGSGLGLAIVKSIMELHDGSIDLASTPGRGTTVTLRFPAPRGA